MPETSDPQQALREHLLALLGGGNAHATFEQAIAGLAPRRRAAKPEGLPYSPWSLLEHMRIAQWDILEFTRDAKHKSPAWPSGYWPKADRPTAAAWEKSVRQFRADLKAMEKIVADPRTDLYARIPHSDGQTYLREALLVADHNAYHLGQLVVVRRLLGDWKE